MFIQLNARTYNLLQFHAFEAVGTTIVLFTSCSPIPIIVIAEVITYPSTIERDIDMKRIQDLINKNQNS